MGGVQLQWVIKGTVRTNTANNSDLYFLFADTVIVNPPSLPLGPSSSRDKAAAAKTSEFDVYRSQEGITDFKDHFFFFISKNVSRLFVPSFVRLTDWFSQTTGANYSFP